MLSHSFPSNISVTCEVSEALPRAYLDPARLENAIINLAHNSRDAMPRGGHLTLRAETTHLDKRSRSDLPGETARPTTGLCILVIDDGEGMDPITLSHAADPFFTTKPEGKGTGLGLSMAQGFVEQLGGQLDIMSLVGTGTTVRLIIPPSADPAEIAQDLDLVQRISDLSPDGGGLKVMLVEHNLLLRELLAEELAELGASVVQASGAAEALAILHDDAHFDAVISDYRMPGLNGRQLITEIRGNYPAIRAVLLTGLSDCDDPDADEAGEVRPDSVLKKPVTGAELLYTVRHLVVQKRSGSPSKYNMFT